MLARTAASELKLNCPRKLIVPPTGASIFTSIRVDPTDVTENWSPAKATSACSKSVQPRSASYMLAAMPPN